MPRIVVAGARKLVVIAGLVIAWQSSGFGHELVPETRTRAPDIRCAPHTLVAACGYDASGNRCYAGVTRGAWMFNVPATRDARLKAVAGAFAAGCALPWDEQLVCGSIECRYDDRCPFSTTARASEGVPPFVYDATRKMKAAEAGAEGAVSRILLRSPQQLQAKFKHTVDFGVAGNYSKANAAQFSRAINQHINGPGVRIIEGTYHRQAVTHFLDPATGLNVMADPAGSFVSG